MPTGISEFTGEPFYSGSWESLKAIMPVLKIGKGGKLNTASGLTQERIELFQERTDRLIDGLLSELYYTPLRPFNKVIPDGSTKKTFPGDISKTALYWTAGMILESEFQNNDINASEYATRYIEEARLEIGRIVKFGHSLQGQRMKSNYSRTMPPGMQVARTPEEYQ